MSVSLVSYGLGNLGSVQNMLKRIDVDVQSVQSPHEVLASERLLLPGVGAFDAGMQKLESLGLVDAIREFAATGKPLLGICLGMQLLLDGSDEGTKPGLGLISGRSVKFDDNLGVRVPHMGWNLVTPVRTDPLVAGLPEDSRFYFVHSYHVETLRAEHELAVTEYGESFTSMVRSGNVMGAQFHPEKSHHYGMLLLKNFSAL